MPNPCRFCGASNRKITKEHVWPEWLHGYLPQQVKTGYSERWSSAAGSERWQERPLTATVRAFCKVCNSGWMSRLENAAKPIVGPMAIGKAVELDTAAQEIVANWVTMKGLVAVQTSTVEQPVPERHYRRVAHFQGAPPHTAQVWTGHRINLGDPGRPERAQLFEAHFMPVTNVFAQFPLPPDLERYRREGGVLNAMIFQVGHFAALALQHDWPGLRARPMVGTAATEAVKRPRFSAALIRVAALG